MPTKPFSACACIPSPVATIEVSLWLSCFHVYYDFFGSCSGGHDEASFLTQACMSRTSRPYAHDLMCNTGSIHIPVVSHKAMAEVSKIGNL